MGVHGGSAPSLRRGRRSRHVDLNGSRIATLGWLCIAVALAGFVITAVTVWTTSENEDAATGLVKAVGVLFVSAFALADLSLLARRSGDERPRGRTVVALTQGAAVLLAGMLVIAILAEISDDSYFRWVGATAILWVLGTALVPIARRLGRAA